MTRELNKWQIGIKISKDFRRYESGWKVFDFWLLKFTSFPEEGATIQKHHYKGIRVVFRFWIPFENY